MYFVLFDIHFQIFEIHSLIFVNIFKYKKRISNVLKYFLIFENEFLLLGNEFQILEN